MERDDEQVDASNGPRTGGRLIRHALVGLLGALVLAAGVAGGAIWGERRAASTGAAKRGLPTSDSAERSPATAPRGGPMPVTAEGDTPATEEVVEVALSPEAIARAGIKTADVRTHAAGAFITVPATVTSDAYRDTRVHALVGGIVRQVSGELGLRVTRGQPLAIVFSAELADAQMKYLSMRAMLHADHQKLQRTQKLVDLGAASRQELEEITATHHAHETELAAAQQKLVLLGLPPDRVTSLESAAQIVSDVTVTSPASGTIVARSVNPGQVIGVGQELFVVTDLGLVWVIGDLYEKDFGAVRVGTPATISVPSAPKALLKGRVAYIDPRVDAATRTAKVRVEVPNRADELRLGMFVTVTFETRTGRGITLVPRGAVQSIGERAVVYVPVHGDEARFAERPVRLGSTVGELIEVLEGLQAGEKVVTEGSFLLRAEAGRTRTGS